MHVFRTLTVPPWKPFNGGMNQDTPQRTRNQRYAKASRDWSQTAANVVALLAHLAIIVAAFIYVAHEQVSAYLTKPTKNLVDWKGSTTSAVAANFYFTNPSVLPSYACVRGVVTRTDSGQSTETSTFCAPVPPRSTVTGQASYPIDKVVDLCKGAPNSLGVRSLDWDKCTFVVRDVTE